MQAVILAAGGGTRLNSTIPNKCLVEIQGLTLLERCLNNLCTKYVDEFIIIVGFNKEYIINFLGNSYKNIPVRYVIQNELNGIAHGVYQASDIINGSFIMSLSDELFINADITSMVKYFYDTKADCICGVVEDSLQNISKAYTIKINSLNQIVDLVEKPNFSFNNYKGTGTCIFTQDMLGLLEYLPKNSIRGEYEMGDWILAGIKKQLLCKPFKVADKNINVNTQEDYEAAVNFLNI